MEEDQRSWKRNLNNPCSCDSYEKKALFFHAFYLIRNRIICV